MPLGRSRSRERGRHGGAPVAAFTPASLGSTVKLWLRADLGLTLFSSTHVGTWADQSGNGNDATQGTDAARPTTGGTVGTRAALQFSGTQTLANAVSSILGAGTARTFFIVGRSSNAAGGTPLWIRTTAPYFAVNVTTIGGADYIYNDGAGAPQNTTVTAGTFDTKTSDFYASWRFTAVGAAPTFTWNGVAATVTAGVQGTESGTAGFKIGTGLGAWTGVIAEIVVCDTALSAGDLASLQAYARSYYGLS